LFRYGNWFRHHIIVTLIVLLAWYFSFLIIFALPLDVISTVYRQCEEEHTNSDNLNLLKNVKSLGVEFLMKFSRIYGAQCIGASDAHDAILYKSSVKARNRFGLVQTKSYCFICKQYLGFVFISPVIWSLQAVSLAVHPGHPLHINLETILQKVPTELRDRMNRRQLPEDTPTDLPSEKALIRLHKQTIKSLQVLQRTETQWNILVEKIFDLEDTLKNQISRDKRFKRTFQKSRTYFRRFFYIPAIEWYWKCVFYGYMQKVLAIVAGIFSIAVVWSEVTFFNKQPVLSIFAMIVNLARINYDYFTIELLSTIIILYLCYCAYSTVLKIKVLNLYYLAPHHQTNEYSLIFSGMMLSRLTPPLCLNFLGLIHMDSHIIKKQVMETHYTQIMGHMDVIAIISDGFNVYFPMAILVFCLATYFSLGSRLLSMLGFHQFVGDDEMTTDLIEEEKRKRQRSEEASSRRREFSERFPTTGRFRSRGSTDTIRPMTQLENLDNTRSNLLQESHPLESYDGTRYTNEVDTRFPPDSDDIDARFGASTRINERYDSAQELEPRFSDTYQLDTNYRNRVGIPPRGIFD
ncbi:LMBR1 domain-containing protein 2 -like protein, partial [Asbolus verrucosus]